MAQGGVSLRKTPLSFPGSVRGRIENAGAGDVPAQGVDGALYVQTRSVTSGESAGLLPRDRANGEAAARRGIPRRYPTIDCYFFAPRRSPRAEGLRRATDHPLLHIARAFNGNALEMRRQFPISAKISCRVEVFVRGGVRRRRLDFGSFAQARLGGTGGEL